MNSYTTIVVMTDSNQQQLYDAVKGEHLKK